MMHPRHALLWELVLRWYAAECDIAQDPIRFPPPRAARLQLIVDTALQRVIDVLCGEVRWSEAGPGDRAIWVMRSRSPEDVKSDLEEFPDDLKAMTPEEVSELHPVEWQYLKNSRDGST